jgi:hypothetical protein
MCALDQWQTFPQLRQLAIDKAALCIIYPILEKIASINFKHMKYFKSAKVSSCMHIDS